MPITKETKLELINTYGKAQNDSGSPESQVAILTTRIAELTEHLKIHPKDFATRRGLMKMVGRRRRLLNYTRTHRTPEQYKDLITRLGIRK